MDAVREKGIHIMQIAGGIKFSPEQLRIVDHPLNEPTLVNACAGSGKTTMLLIKVMLDILIGEFKPGEITCLTFSRRACKSMIDRYNQILARLKKMGYAKNFVQPPVFKTFDSWFLSLLRIVEPVSVIPGPSGWFAELENHLLTESSVEDKSTQLDNIFACYDYLIDNGLTTNGIYSGGHDEQYAQFKRTQLSEYRRGDPNFENNYKSVVNEYNRLKTEYSKTDFNDIKVKLLRALQDPAKKRKILAQTWLIGELFIDEFQDTNNVQWSIIMRLLSSRALHHLSVIGDDDQAIYAFRGSNPGLILNFQHIFPSAHVFNLSTNYRTAGNILDATKTSITKNHWRLPKELHSSTPGKGHVYRFVADHSNNLFSDVDPSQKASGNPKRRMYLCLKHQLEDPREKNDSIAILVRTNVYKSVTADELATIGYFVSPSKSTDILQNKPLYKSCFHLMAAFTFNNFWDYADEARRIGFKSYYIHVWAVLNEQHLRPIKKFQLSTFLDLAAIRDHELQKDMKRNPNYGRVQQERRAIQADKKARYILNYVQDSLTKHGDSAELLGQLGRAVHDLTSVYYHYMFKKHFISVNLTKQVLNYFKDLTKYYDSLSNFFAGEQYKQKALTTKLKDHNQAVGTGRVHVMTIHQSKGLQFDWVYLIGLSTNEVQPADVSFNHYFAPNITPAQFVKKLLVMRTSTLGYLDSQLTKGQLRQIGMGGKKIRQMLDDLGYYYCQAHHLKENNLTVQQIIKCLANRTISDSPDVVTRLQKSLRMLYNLVRDKSYCVEQERHLQYVGCTRAKKGLCFDVDSDNSPLVSELDSRYITDVYPK